MSKKLMKKLFIVLLGLIGVAVVVMIATGEEENEEIIGGPPGIVIDTGYNATLSGTPFYTVLPEDEDLYDDSLLTCNELGGENDRQQGWYSLVALEDGKTAKEVVFEQTNLQQGDNILAVYYDATAKTFEAMPNKIIKDANGNDLPLLDWNKLLKKGEVIVVNSNRSVDFCKDYKESIGHEEITVGSWNLVSKPDFEKIGYRSIWSVDFAGQNLNQFFKEGNANFDPSGLDEDNLYWIYGGTLKEEVVDDTEDDTTTEDPVDDTEDDSTTEDPVDDTEDDTTTEDPVDDTEDDTTTEDPVDDTEDDTTTTTDPIGANFTPINYPDVVVVNPGFGGINFGDYTTGVPVMSVEDIFAVSGRGTVVSGPVVSGTVKENEKVTLQCGNYRGEFVPSEVQGLDKSKEGKAGDEIAIVLPASAKEEINCDLAVGTGLKLKDDSIDYDEDIILYASKNLNRNDQTISLQFGGRSDNRDYVVFWEPDAGNAKTIRIRARDNINDAWAGCSQIRVSVNGMTFADGSSVKDENFDVTVKDNGKCGDETDMSFAGKDKLQKFPNDSNSFYGTAEAVYYDEIGRGFWAVNNNGEIFENFSKNDGKWRRLPGLSTINRPVSSGGQADYVKDTDQFYVMDSEENGRRYSLISWLGKDNRFYTYEYSGNNIIDGFIRKVDKFGNGVKDTTASKYRNSSTGELEDVVYVAYGCETTLTDTVGRNASPKKFVNCRVQMMTEFGDKVGILGNDFLMQGDRYFASVNNVWGINSFNGWTNRYNVTTKKYKEITTSGNANKSSVQELFFNNGNAYGINSQKRLFAWNDTDSKWKEVDHVYSNGSTKLADVEYVGGGMVYADWGANDKVLFQVICESVIGTGNPSASTMSVGCSRSGEYGTAIRLDGSKAIGTTRFEDHVVFTFEGSERNLYRIKDKSNGSRAGVLSTRIEGFNTGKIKQVVSAGDRIFVLFENGGDRYLINPDVDIKAL